MKTLDAWLAERKPYVSLVYAKQLGRWVEEWKANGLAEAGAEKVEAYFQEKRKEGKSASALRQELVYLKQVLRERGSQAADKVRIRGRGVEQEYATLGRQEEQALKGSGAPEWLKDFVVIACRTGLREGTIRAITGSMLDRKGKRLVLPGRVMKQRKCLTVPVTDEVFEVIARRAPEGTDRPLFEEMPAAPGVWKEFKRWGKRLGWPEALKPHDLRRTFVARLTEAGAQSHLIMALGGWRSMSTILTHYASQAPEGAARAVLEKI